MQRSKILKTKTTTLKLEIETYKDAGGQIRVLTLADSDDVRRAEKLPHIFRLTEDKKWNYLSSFDYAYQSNAKEQYREFKNPQQVLDFSLQNA